MNELLSLLFPSAFGTLIYISNAKNEKHEKTFCIYLINTLLTNFIMFLYMYELHGTISFKFTNIFTLKYIFFSSIISLLLGTIISLLDNTFTIKITVTKNTKKPKKSELEKKVKLIEQTEFNFEDLKKKENDDAKYRKSKKNYL